MLQILRKNLLRLLLPLRLLLSLLLSLLLRRLLLRGTLPLQARPKGVQRAWCLQRAQRRASGTDQATQFPDLGRGSRSSTTFRLLIRETSSSSCQYSSQGKG